MVVRYNPHGLKLYDAEEAQIDWLAQLQRTTETEWCLPVRVQVNGEFIEGPRMAVGYHRPYRLASAPPLTRHSLVALGLISRLGGLDHGIVQGHRGMGVRWRKLYPERYPNPLDFLVCFIWIGSLSNQSYIYLIINIINQSDCCGYSHSYSHDTTPRSPSFS